VPAVNMVTWVLQSLRLLDYPAGRYTQIRTSPIDGLPTIVWNGVDGLRFSRCVDPVCSSWTPPVTLPVDPNPRFIRMEFALGLPVLVYAAASDTELHVTRCADQACKTIRTLVVGRAQTVRHPGLAVTDEGEVVVAAELSNASLPPTGCTLTLLLLAADPLAVLRSVEVRQTDRQTPRASYDPPDQTRGNRLPLPSPYQVDRSATPYEHNASRLPTGGFEMPSLLAGGRHLAYLVRVRTLILP